MNSLFRPALLCSLLVLLPMMGSVSRLVGGTLLRQSFEAADWPARTLVTSGGATGTVSYGAYGTVNTPTNIAQNGVDVLSKGLLLTVNSSASVGAWKASLGSGVLSLTTNNTTITDLRLITLAFSLRASSAHPVVVRLESYDAAGTVRTGGLSRLIYPAAPNYYQRFALDLSTFAPHGAGTFVPTATKILLTFELDSTAGGDGWPAATSHTLKIDNLHYASARWYVAPSPVGNNSTGDGSAAKPYATPNKAIEMAQPGDIIVLRGGTYVGAVSFRTAYKVTAPNYENKIGAPDGWITLKNYPGESPVVRNSTWGVINIGLGTKAAPYAGAAAAYLEIRGLTVRGYMTVDPVTGDRNIDPAITANLASILSNGGEANCNGIFVEARNATHLIHDIRIADNIIELNTGGGVGIHRADRVMIENNISRNNSWWMSYGGSGLSTLVPADFENNGDVRSVLQHNQCYGNETMAPALGNDLKFTDGNGIIIDVNRNVEVTTSTNDPAYRARTLVQNNLLYNNGGSGIHAFKAQNVDILHNTAYLNSASPRLLYGQIYAGESKNVRMIGNILVAPANPSGDPSRNEPYTSNGASNVSGTIFYQNNLYFGLGNNVTVPSGHVLTPTANFANNQIANPLFVAPARNPAYADFRLRAASPARNVTPVLANRSALDTVFASRPLVPGTADQGAFQVQPNTVFPPLLSPAPGNYTGAQSVTLASDTAGASFVYTTNGSAPTVNLSGNPVNGTLYTGTAIPVTAATTLRVIAWKAGLATSSVTGGDYTFFNASAIPIPDLIFVPTLGLDASNFGNTAFSYPDSTLVGIVCLTPGALVRYTTDGSTPTPTYGTLHGQPMISITRKTVLKAIAYLPGRPNSAVKTATYTITGSFGNVSAGTVLETLGANRVRFVKFTSTSAISLAQVYARVSGAGTYRVALYSDSSGQPSTRLATSGALLNPAAGWATFTFTTPYAVAKTTAYWLAIWSDSATAQIYANTTGGTVLELASTLGGNGTWPNPVGTTAVSTNASYNFALYATPANNAPVVTVASSSLDVLLSATASVSATVSDDTLPKLPGTTSVVWSKQSGPGTVTFANASALATTASFTASGDYVLRVTASDGSLSQFSEVTVSVSAALDALDPTPPAGIVRARFTDGVGTTYPQQFAGVAGDGWVGPWTASAASGATVVNTTPLQTGGGNYLKLARTAGTNTAEGLFRQWSTTTRPYQQFSRLTFTVRLDSDATVFSSYGDNLNITDRSGGSVGTGGDSRFYIVLRGAAVGSVEAREWGVYNGDGLTSTYSDNNVIPSGLLCVPGVTYSFTIDVFAAAAAGTTGGKTHGTYDVTISDGTTTVTVPGSRFRAPAVFNSGGYLGFSTVQSAATDNLSFSVDNIEITSVAPTTTALAASGNPVDFGEGVTYTATVTSSAGTPTGLVAFFDGSTQIGTGVLNGSGVATFTTTSLDPGLHTVTASYLAGPSYLASASTPLNQTVLADTVTTLTSSVNPANLGASVTFTAKVTSEADIPTGTVTFITDSIVLGVATLNSSGEATFTTSSLSVGRHVVTASYSGAVGFSVSAPAVLNQTIQRPDGTTRILAINGGGADVDGSGFEADYGVPSGSVVTRANPIDRTGVTYPAPEAVYQTERYGPNFTYTLTDLPVGTACLVRLHFSEGWWGTVPARTPGIGKRFVNASINGVQRLAAFDILAAAGAPYKAVVREYLATTDATGQLVINIAGTTSSADTNATINGIEVYTVTPIDAWRTAFFTPAQLADLNVSGPAADPDRDGFNNLLEYGLGGTHPRDSAELALLVTGLDTDGYLTLTFNRIADPTLTYEVQGSSDPSTWAPLWSSSGEQNVAGPITVTDLFVADPRRFLRIRVTKP